MRAATAPAPSDPKKKHNDRTTLQISKESDEDHRTCGPHLGVDRLCNQIILMSRKYDRQLQVNRKALKIIQDPATLYHLGSKLIRKKPKLVPRFIWKALLYVVLAPATKEKTITNS
jgi:hypothetical protein